ncbi:MAG: sulfotransferase [Acidimicrobiales bacterium]
MTPSLRAAADRPPERVVLHIGTHKTGTTSLQHFLRDQDGGLLATVGAGYPPGFVLPEAHSELALLTVRPERTWPARIRLPGTQHPTWLAAAEAHVREQLSASPHQTLVYSHEDLSYLRSAGEIEHLRHLLRGPEVQIVVFLREPAALLRSYREQLSAMEFELSDEPSSFAYVAPDSWLVDYDALLGAYRRGFGEDNVHVIDYDEVVRCGGSVIPAFAQLLGIASASLPSLDQYFRNRTGTQRRPTDEQLAAIRRRIAEQAT